MELPCGSAHKRVLSRTSTYSLQSQQSHARINDTGNTCSTEMHGASAWRTPPRLRNAGVQAARPPVTLSWCCMASQIASPLAAASSCSAVFTCRGSPAWRSSVCCAQLGSACAGAHARASHRILPHACSLLSNSLLWQGV